MIDTFFSLFSFFLYSPDKLQDIRGNIKSVLNAIMMKNSFKSVFLFLLIYFADKVYQQAMINYELTFTINQHYHNFRQMYNIKQICLLLYICTLACSLSALSVITTSPTYTTGTASIISSPSNKINNAGNTFSVVYSTPAPSSSVNASIGINSMYFEMKNASFGWKVVINSVTATTMIFTASTNNLNNYIRMLSICYMINWNANINLNYILFTLNPATDPLANNSLAAPVNCTTPIWSGSCTAEQFANIAYNPIGAINTVQVFLAGVFASNIPSWVSYAGVTTATSSITSSSFTLTLTTYNQAEISEFSFFYLSYSSSSFVSPYFVFSNVGKVGCYYTGSGCGGGGGTPGNNSWSTVSEPYNYYSSYFYFYGLSTFIVDYDGSSNNANFANFSTTSTTLGGGGAYSNSFTFSGNPNNNFHMRFSYFFLLTASCPTTGDIYLVYGSFTFCNNTCSNWMGQYADVNKTCQLCHATCFTCNGPLATDCTGCYSYQNRVLSGNTCICDPSGFYDDGSSITCPSCHYSCSSCTGPSSAQCTACQTLYHRTISNNSCPCNAGYYDSGTQICQACNIICQTCSGSSINNCLSCYSTMFRVLSGTTCSCMAGYYDSGAASKICSLCHYSCATCSTINTNCTSCNSSNSRFINSFTCPCQSGYFDNSVALCVICHPTCLTCNGPLSTNCLTCDALANRGPQLPSCPCKTGMYSLNNVCVACHYSCLNCTAGTATDCTACSSALQRTYNSLTHQCLCNIKYYDAGAALCASCSYTCQACNIAATNCTSCLSSYKRTLTGNTCPCDPGYVDVLLTGSCSACPISCYTCSGASTTQCTSCPAGSGRTLSSNPGSCLCPTVGYFDNLLVAACQLCSPYCYSCSDQYQTTCTNCDATLLRSFVPSFTGSTSGSCLCISHYYDSGVLLCSACNPICLTCTGTATNCTSCDSVTNHRAILAPNSCPCQSGYYETGATICPPCSSPCVTCVNASNICISCSSGRTLVGSSCVCNPGTFQNSSLLCQTCSYSCATCVNSSTTCLSCPSGSYRSLQSTTCPCTTGYYDNLVAVCLPCSYTCQACTSATQCSSCFPNSFRTLQANFSCTCNSGYYDNGANSICPSCSPVCLSCQLYSQCLSCNSGLFRVWDSVALACPCIANYYESSGVCLPCHYSCLSCFGSTSTTCYTCASLRTFTSPSSCPCSSGLYEVSGACIPCSLNCKTCNISSTNCTSCYTSSYLSGNTCICTTGFYLNGVVCSPCTAPCLSCSISSTTCTACDLTLNFILQGTTCICINGTFLSSGTSCVTCNSKCLTCTGASSADCSSCDSALSRSLTGTQCLCITGYYDSGASVCQLCNSQCVTCNGPSNLNCTSCNSSFVLIGSSCMPIVSCSNYYYQGICLNSCPSGTYPSAGVCVTCSSNCFTCTSSLICLTCTANTYYYSSNSSCLYVCPVGTYPNSSICQSCPVGCTQCSMRGTIVVCSSCQAGYYYLKGNCTLNCPVAAKTHVIILNFCLPCADYCQTCTALASNACLTCKSSYYLLGSICYSQCPEGYYASQQSCLACPTSCLTCLKNKCIQCANSYYLSHGKCTKQGTFLDDNEQTHNCHPNCLTCTNSSFSSCILCSHFRGDSLQAAIGGYCDCWKDSIDIGQGKCSQDQYKSILSINQGLVSVTTAANYFSIIGSVVTFNVQGPLTLIAYQQLYSQFYYLNSSSVLQTDWVLDSYLKMNINQYLNNNSKQNSPFSRRLEGRMLSYQTDQSLFMRDENYVYLCDWAMFSIVCVIVIIVLIIVVTKVNKCYEQPKKTKEQKGISKKNDKLTIESIFKAASKLINQQLLLLFYLLTLNETVVYGAASFKILALSQATINIFKLTISCSLLLFCLLYFIRLLKMALCLQQSSKIICFGFLKTKFSSMLSRLYVPLSILRNIMICLLLVFTSASPLAQSASCLGIYCVFMVYSFIYCPFGKPIRVFLHLHQILMVIQMGILTANSTAETTSKLQMAIFLIFFNFGQVGILLGLNVFIMIRTLCMRQCHTEAGGKIENDNSEENKIEDNQQVIANQKINELEEGSFQGQKSVGSDQLNQQQKAIGFYFPNMKQKQSDQNNSLSNLDVKNNGEEFVDYNFEGNKQNEVNNVEVIRKRYRKKMKRNEIKQSI